MSIHAIPLPGLAASPSSATPPKPTQGDPLEYISASRLKCWQTCRLQFRFRYVDRIPTATSPALLVGQVVHRVLQAWNIARWRGEDASVDQMQRVFETAWTDGCEEQAMVWDTPDREAKERSTAWSILDHYLQHSPVPQDEKPETQPKIASTPNRAEAPSDAPEADPFIEESSNENQRIRELNQVADLLELTEKIGRLQETGQEGPLREAIEKWIALFEQIEENEELRTGTDFESLRGVKDSMVRLLETGKQRESSSTSNLSR